MIGFLKLACCLILLATVDLSIAKGLYFYTGMASIWLILAVYYIIEEEIQKWQPLP